MYHIGNAHYQFIKKLNEADSVGDNYSVSYSVYTRLILVLKFSLSLLGFMRTF